MKNCTMHPSPSRTATGRHHATPPTPKPPKRANCGGVCVRYYYYCYYCYYYYYYCYYYYDYYYDDYYY